MASCSAGSSPRVPGQKQSPRQDACGCARAAAPLATRALCGTGNAGTVSGKGPTDTWSTQEAAAPAQGQLKARSQAPHRAKRREIIHVRRNRNSEQIQTTGKELREWVGFGFFFLGRKYHHLVKETDSYTGKAITQQSVYSTKGSLE